MASSFYTVLGGNTPEVVDSPPFLTRSMTSPIMPIIIKCTSRAEANAALDLHKIFKQNNHTQADHEPEVFARALADSLQISDLNSSISADVENQVHGYRWAKFHCFDNIKDAIIYMVLKGDIERMEMLGLLDTTSTNKINKTTSNVFSHIRDFTGIIATIYGITTNTPIYPTQKIGRHAGYYLLSHGYTADTIADITKIWADSNNIDQFVETMGSRGMPATEVRWLWDLIRHDDDCGS
ncbi:hypothetical protein C8J57DRAFT_1235585 [Mycena rebaudengoi]|nr:hypothetical protein C8J57DRAFT_1235585 [Mycena rebaudengoi]